MLTRAVLAHDPARAACSHHGPVLAPAAVPPSSAAVYGDGGDGEPLHHRVSVRRVFDESAEDALGPRHRGAAATGHRHGARGERPGCAGGAWSAASWTACRPASHAPCLSNRPPTSRRCACRVAKSMTSSTASRRSASQSGDFSPSCATATTKGRADGYDRAGQKVQNRR